MAAGRDPEGRRRAILGAAAELICEVGIGAVTHRAIAVRAGVALGATTYYFPTLRDLLSAAIAQAADSWRTELAAVVSAGADLPSQLTDFAESYVGSGGRAMLEYELYVAAAHDTDLRSLAQRWVDEGRAVLAEATDPETADAVLALLDGVILQSLVTGRSVDAPSLRAALKRLIG